MGELENLELKGKSREKTTTTVRRGEELPNIKIKKSKEKFHEGSPRTKKQLLGETVRR